MRFASEGRRRLRIVRYWIANTDSTWLAFLRAEPPEEVNFWQPNAVRPVTLPLNAPWLFKRHNRDGGGIVGGAFFAHFSSISPRFAWDAFGRKNGAADFDAFMSALRRYSERPVDPFASSIGASILVQPFFFPLDLAIETPSDWSSNLTRGKTYDTEIGEGKRVWLEVQARLKIVADGTPLGEVAEGYGSPVLVRPRLGQGAFRVMVTDAYERRCVITGERTLPVLEAAHIKPYRLVGAHDVSNGLLLRSDLHTLFDRGYLTVRPDLKVAVSPRIREEFTNGRDYYALDGRQIRLPADSAAAPDGAMLDWHSTTVYLAP